jgi:hypothetical protein
MVAHDTPFTQLVAQIDAQALPFGDFAEAIPGKGLVGQSFPALP